MTCARCQRGMRREVASEYGARPIVLWACTCGERMDDTIWFHRALIKEETRAARADRIMRELLAETAMVSTQ